MTSSYDTDTSLRSETSRSPSPHSRDDIHLGGLELDDDEVRYDFLDSEQSLDTAHSAAGSDNFQSDQDQSEMKFKDRGNTHRAPSTSLAGTKRKRTTELSEREQRMKQAWTDFDSAMKRLVVPRAIKSCRASKRDDASASYREHKSLSETVAGSSYNGLRDEQATSDIVMAEDGGLTEELERVKLH